MAAQNSSPTISLIAHTYNGRGNLSNLAERVHKILEGYPYELIIVACNSSDGTVELANELSHQYPIRLIREDRGDSASAMIAGFNQAKGEILGVMDADLLHPPEKIPELLQEIEDGTDIAVASRYVAGGSIEGGSTTWKAISRGITMLARLVLPSVRKVRDPMSGLFLLKRKVIEGIVLKPGYKILPQVLVRGRSNEVNEVSYTEEPMSGRGAFSIREQLNYLENIIFLATEERANRRFLQFCLVGLSGVGVNMGIFWFLTRIGGLLDLFALIFSIAASIVSNFVLNDIWTFRDRRIGGIKTILVRALKFNLVSAGAITLYYSVYTPLTRFTDIYDLAALAIAIGICSVWNFSMNVLWTWRKSEKMLNHH